MSPYKRKLAEQKEIDNTIKRYIHKKEMNIRVTSAEQYSYEVALIMQLDRKKSKDQAMKLIEKATYGNLKKEINEGICLPSSGF